MSDGTLRALGVLTALLQSSNGSARKKVPLVGIEEPEVALHPGAAGVLREGLAAASRYTQVIVRSHSPDLLDDKSCQGRVDAFIRDWPGSKSGRTLTKE